MPRGPEQRLYTNRIRPELVRRMMAGTLWFLKSHGGPFQSSGQPDLILCQDRRMYGIEMKKPGGTLTARQASRLHAIAQAGGVAAVVTSLEELVAVLDDPTSTLAMRALAAAKRT